MEIKIGSKLVGHKHPCFIIAEAGVNHNGDFKTALKLVDEAIKAGADAVKFQTFKAENLLSKNAPKAEYQLQTTDSSESQLDMLKKLELTSKEFVTLKSHCDKNGILFLSTPFDSWSVDILKSLLDIDAWKVASGEITNLPLLDKMAKHNIPIIMSTGMCSLADIEDALRAIYSGGKDRQIILLHCLSNYPAPIEETNLKAMKTMKKAFGLPVGYSDHTPGDEVVLAAVARGACVIEKHFTLDKTMEGPDHRASLEPQELKEMVQKIRRVESALGTGVKLPAKGETSTIKTLRKSIVFVRDVKAGEAITEDMVAIKRPGDGLPAKALPYFLGLTLNKNVKEGDLLTKEMFYLFPPEIFQV